MTDGFVARFLLISLYGSLVTLRQRWKSMFRVRSIIVHTFWLRVAKESFWIYTKLHNINPTTQTYVSFIHSLCSCLLNRVVDIQVVYNNTRVICCNLLFNIIGEMYFYTIRLCDKSPAINYEISKRIRL